jgi:bifunctional oligoribonuclease and PAP phosphatase NrnA
VAIRYADGGLGKGAEGVTGVAAKRRVAAEKQQRALAAVLAAGIDDARAEAAWRLVLAARRILLLAHHNPDPDALGSSLGLAYALELLGKACVVACADPVPENYTFLPGRERVVAELPDEDFDLVIALDAGDLGRYGAIYERHKAFFDSARILNIDHHATSTGCGIVNIIDVASAATAELLTLLLLNRGATISRDAAQCLLAGIITDTRSFEYDATTPRTLAAGAYLVGCGVAPETIIKPMYRLKRFEQTKLWGRVLDSARREADGLVVWATLRQRDLEETGAAPDMDDGLPSYLLDTVGVQIALFLREGADGTTRLSVRTGGPWDASKISAHYGGGGHMRAAGCTIQRSLDEAARDVVAYVLNVIATGTY